MLTPQFILPLSGKLICDLFAGGGGASTGIEQALGRHVDIAINHDREAVWWAKQEHSITNPKIQNGGTFRSDRPSYAQMLAFTGAQADAFGHAAAEAEDGIECLGCTD